MMMDMSTKRIVLFGGTFDPIHLGHTEVALAAGQQMMADKIIFVPARRSPLKAFFPEASDEDRLEMIKLAIKDNTKFSVSDYELKKPGPSYTIETVRYFRGQPGNENWIFWLIGADTVEDLPHWYKASELIDECNLAVMHRSGYPVPDFTKYIDLWGADRVRKLQQNIIETPLVDISSTEIRKRLSSGKEVNGLVSPEVLRYISEHRLYGIKDY